MIKSTFQKTLRHFAMRHGKFKTLFVKFCSPTPQEYAEFMRRHGKLYAMGDNCSMLPTTIFTDPAYVRVGNNVHFSSCTSIGHDGSITMLNQAYGVKLDSVGKIDIGDNVFIGHGVLILPELAQKGGCDRSRCSSWNHITSGECKKLELCIIFSLKILAWVELKNTSNI